MKNNGIVFMMSGLALTLTLSGCASVQSRQIDTPRAHGDDGLVYRLPKRGINIGITFEEGKQPVLTVTEGTPFADASGPTYIAKIRRNGVGETDAEINVTQQGLLSTTTAKYTSKIDDFIKALANTAASLSTSDTGSASSKPPQSPCPTAGVANFTSYIGEGDGGFQFSGSGRGTVELIVAPGCNVTVTLQRAGWLPRSPIRKEASLPIVATKADGFFYRVNMPYVVHARLETAVKQTIIMLPDESPTYYIELPRALFASTDNTTTFTDGILTKHKQKTDSEVIAAIKIPADLLRAYTSALGSFFDSFKSTGIKEAQADTQEVLNEIQRQKLEACIIALRNDPTGTDTSDALCAGIAMPSG